MSKDWPIQPIAGHTANHSATKPNPVFNCWSYSLKKTCLISCREQSRCPAPFLKCQTTNSNQWEKQTAALNGQKDTNHIWKKKLFDLAHLPTQRRGLCTPYCNQPPEGLPGILTLLRRYYVIQLYLTFWTWPNCNFTALKWKGVSSETLCLFSLRLLRVSSQVFPASVSCQRSAEEDVCWSDTSINTDE